MPADTHPLLGILAVIAFAVAIVLAPVAWFRMVTAQSRSTHWRNMLLFVAPILLVFLLANPEGLFDLWSPEADEIETPPVTERFARMPRGRAILLVPFAILLGLAAAVWIIGGNLLWLAHKRRTGKTWRQVLNPLDPPFKDYNAREWTWLVLLVVFTLVLGAAAIRGT